MIGRLLCRLGLHRWGPWGYHLDAGEAVRGCQRRGCESVESIRRLAVGSPAGPAGGLTTWEYAALTPTDREAAARREEIFYNRLDPPAAP
jgi:hypothetical protein